MIGIEEQIKNSICYGVAYDSTTSECKKCDVGQRCEARCRENTYTKSTNVEIVNDKTKRGKSATNTPKPTMSKAVKQYDPNMPDLKTFTVDELLKLVEERKCAKVSDFDNIASPQIRRMRIVMALKASYEI